MRRHAAKEQEKLFLCVYLDGHRRARPATTRARAGVAGRPPFAQTNRREKGCLIKSSNQCLKFSFANIETGSFEWVNCKNYPQLIQDPYSDDLG